MYHSIHQASHSGWKVRIDLAIPCPQVNWPTANTEWLLLCPGHRDGERRAGKDVDAKCPQGRLITLEAQVQVASAALGKRRRTKPQAHSSQKPICAQLAKAHMLSKLSCCCMCLRTSSEDISGGTPPATCDDLLVVCPPTKSTRAGRLTRRKRLASGARSRPRLWSPRLGAVHRASSMASELHCERDTERI